MELFGTCELARRIEASHAAVCGEYGETLIRMRPALGAQVLHIGGGIAELNPEFQPLSQTHGIGMNGPVSEDDFDRIEALYWGAKLPSRILVCPMAEKSFVQMLGVRGYRIVEFENVLVRALRSDESLPGPPAGMEVRPIRMDEVSDLSAVIARGFRDGADPPAAELGLFEVSARCPMYRGYGAWIEGRLIAGGVATNHDGIFGLSGASTLPEFRGRGAQRALSHARLNDAAKLGCDVATITTQPGSQSQRNAERLGFRVVYTKVVMEKNG